MLNTRWQFPISKSAVYKFLLHGGLKTSSHKIGQHNHFVPKHRWFYIMLLEEWHENKRLLVGPRHLSRRMDKFIRTLWMPCGLGITWNLDCKFVILILRQWMVTLPFCLVRPLLLVYQAGALWMGYMIQMMARLNLHDYRKISYLGELLWKRV